MIKIDKILFGVNVVLTVFIMFFFLLIIKTCVSRQYEQHKNQLVCKAEKSEGDYFVDPVLKVCGYTSKYKAPVSTIDSCEKILALPEFADMRHCWEKK
jgi:hypothetical protein